MVKKQSSGDESSKKSKNKQAAEPTDLQQQPTIDVSRPGHSPTSIGQGGSGILNRQPSNLMSGRPSSLLSNQPSSVTSRQSSSILQRSTSDGAESEAETGEAYPQIKMGGRNFAQFSVPTDGPPGIQPGALQHVKPILRKPALRIPPVQREALDGEPSQGTPSSQPPSSLLAGGPGPLLQRQSSPTASLAGQPQTSGRAFIRLPLREPTPPRMETGLPGSVVQRVVTEPTTTTITTTATATATTPPAPAPAPAPAPLTVSAPSQTGQWRRANAGVIPTRTSQPPQPRPRANAGSSSAQPPRPQSLPPALASASATATNTSSPGQTSAPAPTSGQAQTPPTIRGFLVDSGRPIMLHSDRIDQATKDKVKDKKNQENGFVIIQYDGQNVRVSADAFDTENKVEKGAARFGKLAQFAGSLVGLVGDAKLGNDKGTRLDALNDSGNQEKQGLLASAGGNPISGKVVYGDLTKEQKEVYGEANYYDPTFEAVSGGGAAAGDVLSLILGMRDFINKWHSMTPSQKLNAGADLAGSVVSTAASVSNLAAQAQIAAHKGDYGDNTGSVSQSAFGMRKIKVAGTGENSGKLVTSKEDYQATDVEKGSIALGLGAAGVKALLDLKDALKNTYVLGNHIIKNSDEKGEVKGGIAREGVSTIKSFGNAVKSGLEAANKIKEFVDGASAVAAEALPILGIVLNAIEIFRRGMDAHRAYQTAEKVHTGKSEARKELRAKWLAEGKGVLGKDEKLKHGQIRTWETEIKAELENLKKSPSSPEQSDRVKELEGRLKTIRDYSLDRDLENTADKRFWRAILLIAIEAQSLTANILTLTGQLQATAALKASATATSLAATGVRKVKQFARDRNVPGTNQNKTTESKNARYIEIAESLYVDFIDILQDLQAARQSIALPATSKGLDDELGKISDADQKKQLENRNAILKARVKAAGLSWREFCAEKEPGKKFGMLVAGQKKREE